MARTKKARTPAEEEAIARKRAKALEKARKARQANSQQKIATKIWAKIEPRIKSCRCGLYKGMTMDDLRKLGAGCTDPYDYEHRVLGRPVVVPDDEDERREQRLQNLARPAGYVCPVLNSYRRYVERPATLYDKD